MINETSAVCTDLDLLKVTEMLDRIVAIRRSKRDRKLLAQCRQALEILNTAKRAAMYLKEKEEGKAAYSIPYEGIEFKITARYRTY